MPSPQRPSPSKGSSSNARGTNTTASRPSSRGGRPRRAPTAMGPEGEGEVQTVLRRQYITYANNHMYYRKYDVAKKSFGDWQPVADNPFVAKPSDGLKTLSVVRQKQEPPKDPHWSLFAHENDSDRDGARVWQVWGDHQCMTYYHTPASKLVPNLLSDSYQDHRHLNKYLTKAQEETVDRICNTVVPPSAPSPREIKENCRTWVMKVLRELSKHGIVKQEDVDKLDRLGDPVSSGQSCGTNCP